MTSEVAHLLRTLSAVPVTSRVLDLTCGSGDATTLLVQMGFEVHACAADPTDVLTTRLRLEPHLGRDVAEWCVIESQPRALGYPDAFFDWVVALGSLDGRTDKAAADILAEARRVLRPGGWLFWVGVQPAPYTHAATLQDGWAEAEAPVSRETPRGPVYRGILRQVAGMGDGG